MKNKILNWFFDKVDIVLGWIISLNYWITYGYVPKKGGGLPEDYERCKNCGHRNHYHGSAYEKCACYGCSCAKYVS